MDDLISFLGATCISMLVLAGVCYGVLVGGNFAEAVFNRLRARSQN